MNRLVYFILLFASVAGAFLAGTWYNHGTPAVSAHTGGRNILYYTDPMHPAYRSDKPGTAPDCGMPLEPIYADGGAGTPRTAPALPGAVELSAAKRQLSGVRVSRVETASGQYALRLFGRVAPDEARIYKLNAGIEGFIQKVAQVTTGSRVQKNQLLATFSAPNATMTIQTYILNLGASDRFTRSAADGSAEAQALPAAAANIQQRVQQLQNLGMSLVQMEEIRRTRQVPDTIKILAPADGLVLERNVSPGQKFERGTEWYRIADLRRVWILTDVFEKEARYLRPGMRAQVIVRSQEKTFPATVSEILPQFDPATRTLKARLEVDNPEYVLRPDMFVDVQLRVNYAAAIAVPADAVLDSGLAKTVFVDRGEGVFEPREVETGRHLGGLVEILKGLQPGERIVVSGNFLLDSESRMRQAAAPVRRDPVCGMYLDAGTQHAGEHGDKRYYFCSGQCKQQFDRAPEQYSHKRDAS